MDKTENQVTSPLLKNLLSLFQLMVWWHTQSGIKSNSSSGKRSYQAPHSKEVFAKVKQVEI